MLVINEVIWGICAAFLLFAAYELIVASVYNKSTASYRAAKLAYEINDLEVGDMLTEEGHAIQKRAERMAPWHQWRRGSRAKNGDEMTRN